MISVIIPNYNHARYLNQRIDSVLNQTYQDFEVIILDDCSTDDSRKIIETYRPHPKVSRIIFNETNSGSTFKQWDKGIAIAKGEYIWIAESDDYAAPSFLEVLTGSITSESEIGLIYCGSNTVDENGVLEGKNIRDVTGGKYYFNSGYRDCLDYSFFTPTIPNASAVIFKKEKIYQVDTSFKQYKICGDWQFWIDICFDNNIVYWPECLNYFRQSSTSVSRSGKKKDTLTIFALEKLKIALYVYKKTEEKISFFHRLRYIDQYIFEVLLESSRKRIFLRRSDWGFILRSMFKLSLLTPFIFARALFRVSYLALKKVKKKLLSNSDAKQQHL